MNTNDLPPAARLAALIEAGRAANPDLKQGVGALLFRNRACALGFASLAAGVRRDQLRKGGFYATPFLPDYPMMLRVEISLMNDKGASLEEICHSLREGELAKVPA